MNRVEVEPRLIQWAIDRAGLSPVDLQRKFPKIDAWATGDVMPTVRQLEAFAKKTAVPLGYLFLKEPPKERLPIRDFRTVGDRPARRPSPNLMETIHTMQRRQDFMREFLISAGYESLTFVAGATAGGNVSEVAGKMRDALGLSQGWARANRTWTDALKMLREAAEEAGILVVINGVVANNTRRKLDPRDFRGFALIDEWAPLVFVNGADAKAAQMFTMAHEMAHVFIGEAGVSDLPFLGTDGPAVERFCNRVAAEFLLPAVELKAMWPNAASNERPFGAVARHFKVSEIVAARRTFDLGLIDREGFRAFFAEAVERARPKKQAGGNFWNTQSQRIGYRFGKAVVQAAREGRLLYANAYDLCGLYGSTFDRYAEKISGRPLR
jgi:Zn-dependent peptidase ImmA (M78 family)